MSVPVSSFWETLDAQAGALHRELAQAMQQVAAIERLIHVRRNARADEAIIRSAVAYVEACLHKDSAQMVQTFVALRDAVSVWLLMPAERESKDKRESLRAVPEPENQGEVA